MIVIIFQCKWVLFKTKNFLTHIPHHSKNYSNVCLFISTSMQYDVSWDDNCSAIYMIFWEFLSRKM